MATDRNRLDRETCAQGFVRAAQYFANMLSTADVLAESRQLIRGIFGPEIVCCCTPSHGCEDCGLSEADRGVLLRVVAQVMESGLMAMENLDGGGTTAVVVVPVSVRGRTVAALVVGYAGEQALPSHALEALLGVASLVGATLARQQADRELLVLAEERAARAVAELTEGRVRLLAEVSKALSTSFDYEAMLKSVARLLVPRLGDACAVELRKQEPSVGRQVQFVHIDPSKAEVAERLTARIQSGHPGVLARVMGSDEPEFEGRKMVAPIAVRESVLGAISVIGSEERQPYGPEDLALVEEVGRRAGTAIENSRLYEALHESEARWRELADCMPQIIWSARPDGFLNYYNRRWYELTGAAEGSHGDQGWFSMVHPDDRQRSLDAWHDSVLTGASYQIEYRLLLPSTGEYRWHLGRALSVRDAAGTIVRWFGTSTDIHEQKAAAEALIQSEARFRALIEKSCDITIVMDADARYQFWSPSATEALGWLPEEVIGRTAWELELIHPEDRTAIMELHRSVLAEPGSSSARITTRHQHKDGSIRLIEGVGRNLLLDPAVRGIVVNARDVTEQRRLEEQFQQAQKMESIGRLAGGIAHDFNNLLTVILGSAQSLKSSLESGIEVDPEFVEDIQAAGKRASDLTRQLLAFARKQVIDPGPLALNATVRNSERWLRRMLREDIELVLRLQPDLWQVRCDPGQIEQVIMNLVVNARDAMPGGGQLTVETTNTWIDEAHVASHPFMRAGPFVRLAIRDSGVGMTPEVKAHLFEPFFTTKPLGMGTGLGLATVFGIVKQGGGFVVAESDTGHGATFDVYLPRIFAEAATASAEPATTGVGKETVLLVEDDPQVRKVTVRSLLAGGYRVLVAGDGCEALEVAAREPQGEIHLLVTDLIMPGKNGRAVADELSRVRPDLRVLYVSGYTQDVISAGVVESGIAFLQKPFTMGALLQRVRAVLDSH